MLYIYIINKYKVSLIKLLKLIKLTLNLIIITILNINII